MSADDLAEEATGEGAAVANADRPTTQVDIETALRAVGIERGSTVIVHSALSKMGWVVGGPVAAVAALIDVIGDDGTIVMPAQTGVSDPSQWGAPPVPASWWPTIREHWPVFNPRLTPMRGMGAVVECFARLPGCIHSGHPSVGFVAHGPRAESLMHPHPLEDGLGDSSPLGRLYEAGAHIVLMGVGHGNNTSLHLAEVRALGGDAPMVLDGAPLLVDGERRWVEYRHVDYGDDDFVAVGQAYTEAGGTEATAPLGSGEVRRLPMAELVDFATPWLARSRRSARPEPGR